MLYPKSLEKRLSSSLFQTPGPEYRSAPFWGWNGKLDPGELQRQIECFKEMGMGGFHMHARAGLSTPYLGKEFMDCVKACCEKAKEEGLFAWLYDEDRYPSGPAGGIVTRNPLFTRRYLCVTPKGRAPSFPSDKHPSDISLIASFDVVLDGDGYLLSADRIAKGDSPKGAVWQAYFVAEGPTTEQRQTYVDSLNPKAIEEFAKTTYDRYQEAVGEYFGNVSPAMFTDEPQYMAETSLAFASGEGEVLLPWTGDFAETFSNAYGQDIISAIPELIWNRRDGFSQLRYLYHDHLAERFVGAFCDTLGRWCQDHGILFTGHVMGEGTLTGQTIHCGEAMRCYRAFHLPGIDVLGKHHLEFSTAKQAQSAARQQGAEGLMSELYGASGWDFDFRSFKLQGDWQAACGVTLRVPHHAWYTMQGEAKRDYPGSIGWQAPWWKECRLLEDHFARLNTALTRGRPEVRVGVIHPIESLWVNFGPKDQSGSAIRHLEDRFQGLIQTMLRGLIDFDFISEARLRELCGEGSNPLTVGSMAYDVVIVPGLHTMRRTTLERLASFRNQGGRLIFLGDCPQYVDGVKSGEVQSLYLASERREAGGASLPQDLKDIRFVDAALPDGTRASHLIHTLRREEDGSKWLFLATVRSLESPDVDIPNQGIKFNVGQAFETEILRFSLTGEYILEEYDTQTGAVRRIPASYQKGRTLFRRRWHMHDSLLLHLIPGHLEGLEKAENLEPVLTGSRRFFEAVPVTLDEPNVLLLDMAEYSLDGGEMRPLEEILRLDNICRSQWGLPPRKRAIPQPYQISHPDVTPHKVTLRFRFESELELTDCRLAMENPLSSQAVLNGLPVDIRPMGYFTDPSIQTFPLPPLAKGENVLDITCIVDQLTGVEYCYLLGDFGVRVSGVRKSLTSPVRELAFGSWTSQGLPFYSGNVTYHLQAETGPCVLRVPHYRGALMRVWVDGADCGPLIYSPYALQLDRLKDGLHKIDIKLYGTRQNTFAPLHHLGTIPFSQGPDSWRSTHDLWNYEYFLSDKGILSSPRIYRI